MLRQSASCATMDSLLCFLHPLHKLVNNLDENERCKLSRDNVKQTNSFNLKGKNGLNSINDHSIGNDNAMHVNDCMSWYRV